MKFLYEYRTPDNEKHSGKINASDKEAAYAALKRQGIKPCRFSEAPGFFNKLLGKGKRWTAIGVLAVLCAVLCIVLFRSSPVPRSSSLTLPRQQLYGDPEIIQQLSADGWRKTFADPGDAFLARHAIPGLRCGCVRDFGDLSISTRPLAIDAADGEELAKMKRLVNGMKEELAAYLASGGSLADYMTLCCERLGEEHRISAAAERELNALAPALAGTEADFVISVWREKNEMLRTLGLRTIALPKKSQNSGLTSE